MTHPNDSATKADITHVNGRIDHLDADIKLLRMQTRGVEEKLDNFGTDLRNLEVKVGSLDDKVSSLDDKVTNLDGKVSSLDDKVTNLDGKVSSLDDKVDGIGSDVRRLEVLHEEMDGKLDAILEALGPKMVDITAHGDALEDHERRIATLETFKKAAA